MSFEIPKITYSGKINETRIGQGEKAVTVGGENSYPFYLFEGQMPHLPKIAFEIYDSEPEEWPPSILKPFQDVIGNPAAWARKCLREFKAESICLRLTSTDPNGLNR